MINPKVLITLKEGATYGLPAYQVTENGLEDSGTFEVPFVKGNKEDESIFRQNGILTESLIQCAKQFMESVNVGDLACRENSMAITKLDEALMWINKRAEDRKLRGVQGTYQK